MRPDIFDDEELCFFAKLHIIIDLELGRCQFEMEERGELLLIGFDIRSVIHARTHARKLKDEG